MTRAAKTTVIHIQRGVEYDVFIGRPSKWGNPFRLHDYGEDRALVARKFRSWALRPEQAQLRADARRELKGKRLGCYCATAHCHGQVWVDIAEGEEGL